VQDFPPLQVVKTDFEPPTQLLIQFGILCLGQDMKWVTPTRVEAKEMLIYTSTPHASFMAYFVIKHGDNLPNIELAYLPLPLKRLLAFVLGETSGNDSVSRSASGT
jgi:hypothetical protein